MQILIWSAVFWGLVWGLYSNRIVQEDRLVAVAETVRVERARRALVDDLAGTLIDLRVLVGHAARLRGPVGVLPREHSLSETFTVLARESRRYDQIRLLSRAGRELVRVNWTPFESRFVPPELLQDKSDRYYFQAMRRLDPGQVYLSRLDLNVEHGRVEEPRKPMLRLGMPVVGVGGQRLGYIVLNYLGQRMLDRLEREVGTARSRIELLNPQGFWMHGPGPDLEWGFMREGGTGFAQEDPPAWDAIKAIDAGQVRIGGDLYTVDTVRLAQALSEPVQSEIDRAAATAAWLVANEPYWKLLSRVSADQLLARDLGIAADYLKFAIPIYLALTLSGLGLYHFRNRRRDAERALQASEERKQAIVDSALDAIVTLDPNGRILEVNPSARRLFGLREVDPVGLDVTGSLFPPESREILQQQLKTIREAGGPAAGCRLDLRMRALDGNTFDAALALSPLHFGENLQVSLFVRDVTERRRAQQLEVQQREGLEREVAERTRELTREIAERKRVESKLRQATKAFENTRDAIVITDNESRITAVNAAFTEISGYSEDEVLGKLPWFFDSSEDAGSPTAEVVRAVQGGGSWQGELPARRRDGTDYPAWLSVSSVRNPYGRLTNFVAVYSDITEIKRSQARLSFMAHHDALTGLPNRVMFSSLLSNAIVRARRAGGRFAVLFLDLDRFKNVNDSLGHDAGDALLKVVAARFRSALRESDALARVGGDEFTVLLESAANREEAGLVAHKLINVVREPVDLGGTEVFVGASIGISMYPEDGDSVDTLLKNADVAMFSAKQGGRDRFQFSDLEQSAAAERRVMLERGLRQALAAGQLRLDYQPMVSLVDGSVVGFEVLLRWRHPRLGLLAPAEFVSIADDTGAIGPIGTWVIRTVCERLSEWRAAGLNPGRIAINLSGRQMRDDKLVAVLERSLGDHGLSPSVLELDLPEAALIAESGHGLPRLRNLARTGVSLAIDDFGDSYAAVGELRRLPVAKLKLDPSLIADLPGSPEAAVVVAALIELGHGLGMQVLAEGVETQAQRDHLAAAGCDQAQGFVFAAPMPFDAAASYLRTLRN